MTNKIRVLLADDHPLVRTGLRTTLSSEVDIDLAAEATDGNETQSLCRKLQPDVLLLDLNMPGPSPYETIAYLREHCPATKALILTAYDDDAYVRGLAAAGVMGYVLKDEAPETVIQAIRAVMQGRMWFSQPVVEKLACQKMEDSLLTEREQQILRLIARGLDNVQIAVELGLAKQTVRNYVSRIYACLELNSRTETIVWARERGLV